MAYFAAQRTHEIGVRMALGAMPASILRLLLEEAVATTLFGLAMGLAGALGVTRYLTSLLFKTRPVDPVTLAAVCLVMAAVALVASYLPARRAMKVDPIVALRYE